MNQPPPTAKRRIVVGVFGSSRDEHADRAEPLGRLLAEAGVHLLTGGGAGVMTAACRAFASVEPREGLALGILPGDAGTGKPPPGYPNPWVEVAVRTHLPHSAAEGTDKMSRNHLNVLSCDAAVALPGSNGTRSEIELALRYGRPLIAWLRDDDEIDGGAPAGMLRAESLEDVRAFLRANGVSVP